MTPMTSSAASLTLRAKNVVSTRDPMRRSTSTPPPPGMWTSRRTTPEAAASRAGTTDSVAVLGRAALAQGQSRGPAPGPAAAKHLAPTAAGHVDVEQNDVRVRGLDGADG